MYRLITPTNDNELDVYYLFRWQMLREPWQHPKGSERDAYDSNAFHRMILDSKDRPIAIGRLYINSDNDGQIRFMAVAPSHRGCGIGALMLMALESLARQEGVKRIVCNTPEDVLPFYQSHGFVIQGDFNDDYGPKQQRQLVKHLDPLLDVVCRPDWCQELQQCWVEQIPISEKLGIRIAQFTGYRFEVTALLNANLNPYDTMFAGSVFSMAALSGWGMVWLLMKERHLTASIVLAEGNIRYQKPIDTKPRALVSLDSLSGDLDRLETGRRARVKLEVEIYSGDEFAGVFSGTYMLMPIQND